jgi:hypothetical protein
VRSGAFRLPLTRRALEVAGLPTSRLTTTLGRAAADDCSQGLGSPGRTCPAEAAAASSAGTAALVGTVHLTVPLILPAGNHADMSM